MGRHICNVIFLTNKIIVVVKLFPVGDYFINSHNLFSLLCFDIVRRNLMLVTLGT